MRHIPPLEDSSMFPPRVSSYTVLSAMQQGDDRALGNTKSLGSGNKSSSSRSNLSDMGKSVVEGGKYLGAHQWTAKVPKRVSGSSLYGADTSQGKMAWDTVYHGTSLTDVFLKRVLDSWTHWIWHSQDLP